MSRSSYFGSNRQNSPRSPVGHALAARIEGGVDVLPRILCHHPQKTEHAAGSTVAFLDALSKKRPPVVDHPRPPPRGFFSGARAALPLKDFRSWGGTERPFLVRYLEGEEVEKIR